MENWAGSISAGPMTTDCPREFEDVATSSPEYAARFAGRIGAWLLEVQNTIIERFIIHAERGVGSSGPILDVAGGHGQIARYFCKRGRKVQVVGSSSVCDVQIRDLVEAGQCEFRVGSPLMLALDNRSYAVVTCFRFLPHCEEWKQVISELCRVSRSSVIVDFPPRVSFNALYPILFGLKRKLEGSTRQYALFDRCEVDREFERHGFRRVESTGEFFFPMVVHRMLKVPIISRCLEIIPRYLGITFLFGSPVIARYALKE